jgi:hypothetical protein
MYAGREIIAHSDVKGEYHYECQHCKQVQSCHVFGSGTGTGKSAYFMDDEGAEARARARSARAAVRDGKQLIAIARCPNCSRRPPGSTARHLLFTFVRALGLLAFCLALGVVFYYLRDDDRELFMVYVCGGIGLIAFVGALIKGLGKFEASRLRVHWHEPTA